MPELLHRDVTELLSVGVIVSRLTYKKSYMDKRLAGLSFLLTLGWVAAVAFVMWYFSTP